MVCAGMDFHGFRYACERQDSTLTVPNYIHLLKTELDSIINCEQLKDDFIFQHDIDYKHTAKVTTIYHKTKRSMLTWPCQSLDQDPTGYM